MNLTRHSLHTVTRDLGAFFRDLEDTVTHNSAIKRLIPNYNIMKDQKSGGDLSVSSSNNSQSSIFDYGAFLDAKGHYVGFCSGCEKWHTGILWLQRKDEESKLIVAEGRVTSNMMSDPTISSGVTDTKAVEKTGVMAIMEGQVRETGRGQPCMVAWENILLSGRFTTDQESMDEAERVGACPHALVLPSKHLLFAKDYIAMMFTSGQTFLHLTAAG